MGWQADLHESLPVEEAGVHLRIYGCNRLASGDAFETILILIDCHYVVSTQALPMVLVIVHILIIIVGRCIVEEDYQEKYKQ